MTVETSESSEGFFSLSVLGGIAIACCHFGTNKKPIGDAIQSAPLFRGTLRTKI